MVCRFVMMECAFFVVLILLMRRLLQISRHIMIRVFCLPYFRSSNNALFLWSTTVLLFPIYVVLTIPIQIEANYEQAFASIYGAYACLCLWGPNPSLNLLMLIGMVTFVGKYTCTLFLHITIIISTIAIYIICARSLRIPVSNREMYLYFHTVC